MTAFDIIVILLVGVAAVGGFMRGFVQEVLSLASWILAIFAIRFLHTDITDALTPALESQSGAAVLAFVLLLLIPYAAMKLIAGRLGSTSRDALLGPIDRVLGFGFGAVKGIIIVVMAFSVFVLGYDTVWDVTGRPTWVTNARTYQLVDSSSKAMVEIIAERRARLAQEQQLEREREQDN